MAPAMLSACGALASLPRHLVAACAGFCGYINFFEQVELTVCRTVIRRRPVAALCGGYAPERLLAEGLAGRPEGCLGWLPVH